MQNRAYSLLSIKSIDQDKRIIDGVASTPSPDRVGDIVNPMGAKFSLPMPFLWQHNHDQPIGHVIEAKATKTGISFRAQIARTDEPGPLKDLLDFAWQSIKLKLVAGVSIGFRPLRYAYLNDGGIEFDEWEWFELSAVTIPAQAEATIAAVKSMDAELRRNSEKRNLAASGSVRLSASPTPASGKPLTLKIGPREGQKAMTKIGEQIAQLKEQRKALAEQMEAIQSKALGEGRSKDSDEREKFDELRDQVKALDAEILDLEDVEKLFVAPTVKAVEKPDTPARTVPAMAKSKAVPGVRFAQMAKIKAISKLDIVPQTEVAAKMYGRDSEIFNIVKAGEVAPAAAVSGNWGYDLIPLENGPVADFAAYLHERTILGRFGTGGIPALRRVSFRSPLVIQTEDGDGFWVGEAKPKPVTTFDFDRTTMLPLKCANIAVASMEHIRDSSPSSDMIIRDSLVAALVKVQDIAFIDPANNGTSNVKPASILYQAEAIASDGTDYAAVDIDLRSVVQKFIDANNPLSSGVWIMSEGNAMALGMMRNDLGQVIYTDINMNGGTLLGLPVITSAHVGSNVALVNAQDIHYGDDGDVTVDMSTEASLEMKTGASNMSQNPLAPGTGASLVSLWQNNLVGLRAEKTVNWRRRRASAAAYLTGVVWGGAVNAS
jgi:HK97 family phage prohead protease